MGLSASAGWGYPPPPPGAYPPPPAGPIRRPALTRPAARRLSARRPAAIRPAPGSGRIRAAAARVWRSPPASVRPLSWSWNKFTKNPVPLIVCDSRVRVHRIALNLLERVAMDAVSPETFTSYDYGDTLIETTTSTLTGAASRY